MTLQRRHFITATGASLLAGALQAQTPAALEKPQLNVRDDFGCDQRNHFVWLHPTPSLNLAR